MPSDARCITETSSSTKQDMVTWAYLDSPTKVVHYASCLAQGVCSSSKLVNTPLLHRPSQESSFKFLIQCKPDISRSCISRNWIYRGRMLDPIFLPTDFANFADVVPKSAIFSRNRGNSLHSIRGRQFFAKSAHRDSLCSCSLETIFREINSSLPVNAGWNTCCAMGSRARRSIDTSIVSQSRVQLIQCQCKSRLQTSNLGINNAFNQIAVLTTLFTSAILSVTETVPQQIKRAWLVDIPLAVHAHQNKAIFMTPND